MPQPFAEEFKSIPMSSNLGQSLERAHRFAREQSHRLVTLEHLLLALAEDPEAALILHSANVDLAKLGTEVSGYLGRLLEDMRAAAGVEPRPDAELLRVLQAAASAAQQSRRRQIDGAIVLAAIVGDGKSPAAGLLKALGMTFEEAIRALQRANTKARLSPAAKTAPAVAASAEVPAAFAGAEPAVAEPSAPVSNTVPNEPPPAAEASAGQLADDFLAAARARIQRRWGPSATSSNSAPDVPARSPAPAEPASPPVSADDEPPLEASDPAETEALTSAIEAAMAAPAVRRTEPSLPMSSPADAPPAAVEPSLPSPPRLPRTTWTPPPEPRPQPAARLPQTPAGRPPLPFPVRSLQPGEGPQRPPLPPRPASVRQLPPGFPNRPRAPWPEPAEGGAGVRPALPNGDLNAAHYPSLDGPPAGVRPAPSLRSPPPQRAAGSAERGPLVENIPRRMRQGVAVSGEVRISRDKVESLMLALSGNVPRRPGPPPARALSVRLRAPNGGFSIEAASPETQWVESASNLIHDDAAAWRWTIVPQARGRRRLLLMVSARTMTPDGVAAESAPPDRVIEVKVRGAYGRRLARWAGWIATIFAAALIGRYGEEVWPAIVIAVKRVMAG